MMPHGTKITARRMAIRDIHEALSESTPSQARNYCLATHGPEKISSVIFATDLLHALDSNKQDARKAAHLNESDTLVLLGAPVANIT